MKQGIEEEYAAEMSTRFIYAAAEKFTLY